MTLSFHCKGYRFDSWSRKFYMTSCVAKKKGRNYKNQFLQGEMHMDNEDT